MFGDLTPGQLALRDELRGYFAALMSPAERTALLTERHGTVYRDVVRRMGRDRWLGVGWPVSFGGRGFGPVEQHIIVTEAARADVPLPAVTLQTVGPTLQAHGTTRQKDFFLPKILAGEVHFAIGYTEPEAGTDLAALRTRAVRDGEEYVVNGQKVFTSGSPAGPTRPRPGTRGSPSSSSIPGTRASPGPRSSRTTVPITSTRPTTRTCGSPTRCG
jgi:alkylation response protein AidB-like acyl-CoA dehydrogenase